MTTFGEYVKKSAGPSKIQDKQTNEKINNTILNGNQFAFGFMNLKVHRHLLFDPAVSYLSTFFFNILKSILPITQICI